MKGTVNTNFCYKAFTKKAARPDPAPLNGSSGSGGGCNASGWVFVLLAVPGAALFGWRVKSC